MNLADCLETLKLISEDLHYGDNIDRVVIQRRLRTPTKYEIVIMVK